MCISTNARAPRRVSLGAVLVALVATSLCEAVPFCSDNSGNSPYVCVDWTGHQDQPQPDQHFTFDFSDPTNPDVAFFTGSDIWAVWSQVNETDDTPANLGAIGIDPSLPTDNFSVTIAHGEEAGAANVGAIVLVDQDWTGMSNIAGGRIAGNLIGDLTLQKSGGQGGVASFQILGAAQGDITVREVSYLGIKGDVSGSIDVDEVTGSLQISGDVFGTIGVDTITDTGLLRVTGALTNTSLNVWGSVESTGRIEIWKAVGTTLTVNGDLLGDIKVTGGLDGAKLEVTGNVGPEAFIEIADMVGAASLTFGVLAVPGEFAGDLALLTGVEHGAIVEFCVPLTVTGEGEDEHTPTIDLNGQDVAGELLIWAGGKGNIVNGGAVTGMVGLAQDTTFSGTATFASVAPFCDIKACFSDIDGTIHITGNMDGTIWMSGHAQTGGGNLLSNGKIEIDGDMSGLINVYVDALGNIEVRGDLLADSRIGVDRDILGPITVHGNVEGDILANLDGVGIGLITGAVTIEGEFNGNICGDNLRAMLCDLPVNIDIPNFGLFGTVCGCRCTLSPPQLPPGLDPGHEERFPKNRYLSIAPPQEPGWQTAIRVKLTDTNLAGPEFQAAVGREWWLGQPQRYCENGGQDAVPEPGNPPHYGCAIPPGVPSSTFLAAPLQCTPHFMDWNGVCDEGTCVGGLKDGESCAGDAACWGVVHVFGSYINGSDGNDADPEGSWILPASTYDIQAVHEACGYGYEDAFSESLTLTTSIHGDIVGNFDPWDNYWFPPDGMVDITRDATAVLDKFQSIPYAPIKSRCDVDPEAVEQLINITDVSHVVQAFLGGTYPFDAPDQCAGQ